MLYDMIDFVFYEVPPQGFFGLFEGILYDLFRRGIGL